MTDLQARELSPGQRLRLTQRALNSGAGGARLARYGSLIRVTTNPVTGRPVLHVRRDGYRRDSLHLAMEWEVPSA